MEEHKKTWEKPQLIVLARGTPEESVLTHCKYIGAGDVSGYALTNYQDGCNKDPVKDNCGTCQSRSGS